MMRVETNTSLNYKIEFIVSGDLVSPTSATFTLKQNNGTVLINAESITYVTGSTTTNFPIDASYNIKVNPTEIRYVQIDFIYQGLHYVINDYYQVTDTLIIPVSCNDVRALLGFSEAELSDRQIDIPYAYNELTIDYKNGDSGLQTLISTGDLLIIQIQECIKHRAAIHSLEAIEIVLAQSEQDDNVKYSRFSTIDFNGLIDRLYIAYNKSLERLNALSTELIPYIPIVLNSKPYHDPFIKLPYASNTIRVSP